MCIYIYIYTYICVCMCVCIYTYMSMIVVIVDTMYIYEVLSLACPKYLDDSGYNNDNNITIR